jgi:PAS domain S-box-containing protein
MKTGSELDFAQILNTVGQGVLVSGEGWRFEYVNPAFARIVGKPITDLIGKSMDDFIIPEDLPALAQMRSKRLAGETNTYDFRLRRSDAFKKEMSNRSQSLEREESYGALGWLGPREQDLSREASESKSLLIAAITTIS